METIYRYQFEKFLKNEGYEKGGGGSKKADEVYECWSRLNFPSVRVLKKDVYQYSELSQMIASPILLKKAKNHFK